MDETELLEVLVARSHRGRARGADALIDAVAIQIAPARPRRRRARGRNAFAIVLAAATMVSAVVLVADRNGARRTSIDGSVGADARWGIASAAAPYAAAAPETVVSVHPISPRFTWLLTSRRVLVTHDAGATWTSVLDVPPAGAAFESATRGVVVERAGRLVGVDLVQGTTTRTVAWLDTRLASVDEVHITRSPDQYLLWASDDCNRAEPCATAIFASADGQRWTSRYRGNGLASIRCVTGGDCWAFGNAYDTRRNAITYSLMHSPSGGRDWARIPGAPMPSGLGDPGRVEIVTVTARTLAYEVVDKLDGSDTSTPIVVLTKDHGASFTTSRWPSAIERPSRSAPYVAIVRHGNSTWTAIHDRDVIEASDDTLRWGVVARTPFSVRFARWADAYLAWIAGDGTRDLAYTLDGGRTWTRVALRAIDTPPSRG